jgi:hypothetical protein
MLSGSVEWLARGIDAHGDSAELFARISNNADDGLRVLQPA